MNCEGFRRVFSDGPRRLLALLVIDAGSGKPACAHLASCGACRSWFLQAVTDLDDGRIPRASLKTLLGLLSRRRDLTVSLAHCVETAGRQLAARELAAAGYGETECLRIAGDALAQAFRLAASSPGTPRGAREGTRHQDRRPAAARVSLAWATPMSDTLSWWSNMVPRLSGIPFLDLWGRYRDEVCEVTYVVVFRLLHGRFKDLAEEATQEGLSVAIKKIPDKRFTSVPGFIGWTQWIGWNWAVRESRRRLRHLTTGDSDQLVDPFPEPWVELQNKEKLEIAQRGLVELRQSLPPAELESIREASPPEASASGEPPSAAPEWRERAYRKAAAQLDEIERHKYFLSKDAKRDVGWEAAASDWIEKHASAWREWWERQPPARP